MKRALFLLVLFLGSTKSAFGDSDGHFCVSTDYLAYELRGWSVAENQHVLRVLRVGGEDGIAEPVGAVLEDFQVHGMKCEGDKVILLGWGKRYTVDIKGLSPKVISVEPVAAGQVPEEFQVLSFLYAGTKLIEIPSQSADHKYQLQLQGSGESVMEPGGGIIYHRTVVKIIEKDLSGRITKEKEVYKSLREETIH